RVVLREGRQPEDRDEGQVVRRRGGPAVGGDRRAERRFHARRQSEQCLRVELAPLAGEVRVQDGQRLPDGARFRRRVEQLQVERRVLQEDRLLEPLQGRARLEPDLVAQVGARRLVGGERIRLSP